MSTLDQLVADLATKRRAYLVAERTKMDAKAAWDAALTSCGLAPGVSSNMTSMPNPMPDFSTLAQVLVTALLAEKAAASDFNVARAAHTAALVSAGAQ